MQTSSIIAALLVTLESLVPTGDVVPEGMPDSEKESPATAAAVEIVREFVDWTADNADLTRKQKEELAALPEKAAAGETSPTDLITDGLRLGYPGFETALKALNAETPDASIEAFQALLDSENPYLADAARFFTARAHMLREDYEAARDVLQPVIEKQETPNAYRAAALFEMGVIQTNLVQPQVAQSALAHFLQAAEQYGVPQQERAQAQAMLMALLMYQEGSVFEAADLMDDSRRRLGLERLGDATQERQARIVEILNEVIEQAEQQGQGSGSGSGSGSSGMGAGSTGGAASGTASGAPAETSSLPGGDAQMGELGRTVRGRPEETWGQMPPNEREKALSNIQAQFPNRYRDLVEQYYKGLQEADE